MSAPTPMPTRSSAILARFVAAAFSQPDAELVARLADPAVRAELCDAAATLGLDVDFVAALFEPRRLAAHIDDHARILGHTVRSECPPYELEYRAAEVFQHSQTLADVAGFYRAFGFVAAGPLCEREDHAATEWEFLSALAMKSDLAHCDDERACCRDALRAFLKDHAAVWMPAFHERVRKADADSFLAHAAGLADLLLRRWCAELNVAVGPRWLELRPISDADSTIDCATPGTVELGPTLAAAME